MCRCLVLTEAHESHLLALDLLDECGDLIDRADLLEHAKDGLVGAAVAGSVERARRTRDRREHVHSRRRQVAHRRCRAVQLVVSVQDEQNVQGAGKTRVRTDKEKRTEKIKTQGKNEKQQHCGHI